MLKRFLPFPLHISLHFFTNTLLTVTAYPQWYVSDPSSWLYRMYYEGEWSLKLTVVSAFFFQIHYSLNYNSSFKGSIKVNWKRVKLTLKNWITIYSVNPHNLIFCKSLGSHFLHFYHLFKEKHRTIFLLICYTVSWYAACFLG